MTETETRHHAESPSAPSGRFEVVIAGAGLAGGSLALRLARAGVRVALLDGATFPRDKLCGEFLSPECWGVLDRLGLSRGVERLGFQPVRRVRVTTPRGRVLDSEFVGNDGRPGIALSRVALDDLMIRSAREAGATVIERSRVRGPLMREGRVAGVVARCGAEPPFDVFADVTIAADGRHSALVRQTGTLRTRSRFRPPLFGLKRHLKLTDRDLEPAGTVALHLVPGGYVGTCRVENGATNLCGLLPEARLRDHRGDLDRLVDALFPVNPVLDRFWRSGQPAGAWKTVSGVRVEVATARVPGILYAGDCQGTIDPLGGQGMTMALLGAEMLAPFATRAVAESGASATLQREYEAAWHRRFDRRIALCRAFHHALINPWVIDIASTFSTLAPRLLALGFHQTRDSVPA